MSSPNPTFVASHEPGATRLGFRASGEKNPSHMENQVQVQVYLPMKIRNAFVSLVYFTLQQHVRSDHAKYIAQ